MIMFTTALIFSYIKSYLRKSAKTAARCALFWVVFIFFTCSGKDSIQSPAEDQSAVQNVKSDTNDKKKLKEAEKELADTGTPYIVINFKTKKISIRIMGYVLNEFDFAVTGDSAELNGFLSAVQSKNRADCLLDRVHVFKAIKMVGEMELDAVTRALNADFDTIQKYSPLKMTLSLSHGLIMQIEAEGSGERLKLIPNLIELGRLFFERLSGARTIHLRLSSSDSMALYGVCRDKIPFMFYN